MLQICVIGDSHSAALKKGWALIRDDFPGIELTFFSGVAAEWNNLRATKKTLVPCSEKLREQFIRSSRGGTEISGDFDAYLLCSMGLWIARTFHPGVLQPQPDWAFHRVYAAKRIQNTPCARVLQMLRRITAKPALVVAAPFQPQDFCLFSPMIDHDTAAKIRTDFHEECEALAAAHGARFIPQLASTWAANGMTTRMEFAYLAENREDRYHCNAEYGAVMLRHILEHWPVAD